ncbi:lysine-specific histone demethylase 1 homolog 3 isoform X2 [Physcomitrium patens]|uniref:lysine-specific histone demethylase 1 homolog 3 isoform X2 n=1 Tax=Physcomitrium patens TaxID=3218 RepID=UPI000D175175|nr:lysine-specific histone demethylase 1 homolog 3-like isoform X2 [Physcomitrium patens]|eukprot:XP_024379447.1 lysine-specific histone demethylase 1 homolog 3-like isoform X2 [Physcomitrella patens]
MEVHDSGDRSDTIVSAQMAPGIFLSPVPSSVLDAYHVSLAKLSGPKIGDKHESFISSSEVLDKIPVLVESSEKLDEGSVGGMFLADELVAGDEVTQDCIDATMGMGKRSIAIAADLTETSQEIIRLDNGAVSEEIGEDAKDLGAEPEDSLDDNQPLCMMLKGNVKKLVLRAIVGRTPTEERSPSLLGVLHSSMDPLGAEKMKSSSSLSRTDWVYEVDKKLRQGDRAVKGGPQKNRLHSGFQRSTKKGRMESCRAPRQSKKRRHDDMAYEGDMEWDVIIGVAEVPFDCNSHPGNDKLSRGRGKGGSAFASPGHIFSGEAAAVAAGLRARTLSGAERVCFKDALKRRGGLQEYLECRNLVLGMWEKDVQHLLMVTDCGISEEPLVGEPARAGLIREIHRFLDYHGYINFGVANKRQKYGGVHANQGNGNLRGSESAESVFEGAELDLAEEVALILDQIRGNASTGTMKEEIHCDVPNGRVDSCQDGYESTTRITENRNSSVQPLNRGAADGECIPMDIEVGLNADAVESTSVLEQVDKDEIKPLSSFTQITLCKAEPQEKCEDLNGEVDNEIDDMATLDQVFVRRRHGTNTRKFEDAGSESVEAEGCDLVASKDELDEFKSAQVLRELHKCDVLVEGLVAMRAAAQVERERGLKFKQEGTKRVIVVGAGPAGLSAARHLQRMKYQVTIVEARERVGGRVYTDKKTFSAPVDLGASIITGVEADVATERRADPSALLCKQLDLELTTLRGDCPLYDSVSGEKVPADLDAALEAEYNSLLDDTVLMVAQNGGDAMRLCLAEGLEQCLKKRRRGRNGDVRDDMSMAGEGSEQSRMETQSLSLVKPSAEELERVVTVTTSDVIGETLTVSDASENLAISESANEEKVGTRLELMNGGTMGAEQVRTLKGDLNQLERRIMDWHFANLEYGCAAELQVVSLPYWNQDDVYGGFGGPHCMIKGGYSQAVEALSEGLDIRFGRVVSEISHSCSEVKSRGEVKREVRVMTEDGEEFLGDAVLVTVPLGCLKAGTIRFSPELPEWKTASIKRLGFGVLNKVVLEFPLAFWDENVDYFGATAGCSLARGRCFMFWNLKRTSGYPILVALVVGIAAKEGEEEESGELVDHAVKILRRLFGEEAVPEPVASTVTKWGKDPYSRGAYSYVAVGASGEDYDILARPVDNCVYFAGEATCKEHPDTVGGAMMSGLREAIRVMDIMENRGDTMAEAEALAAAQRQSESERNEVRDMMKRLAAAELSNVLRAETGAMNGEGGPLSRADLLNDMFGNAKTTAGRLFLIKEMLQLPVFPLKAFAGTKSGLEILNTWIMDSMGKDGIQLLRHCVRLLLVVATDLSSIRQSGVGKTVKEKLWMHTSRDIRTVAGQLVKLWMEVFRREKALGMIKSIRKSAGSSPSACTARPTTKVLDTQKCALGSTKLIPAPCSASKCRPPNQSASPSGDSSSGGQSKVSNGEEVKSDQPGLQGIPSSEIWRDSEEGNAERRLSKLEINAIEIAEQARAAAAAAAEAYAQVEAQRNTLPQLPKIPSFYKFSKRDKEDNLDWRTRSWLGIADNPPISTAFNALLAVEQRVVLENGCISTVQANGCDVIGSTDQNTPIEQGQGLVPSLPVTCVAASDINGHPEAHGDGFGTNADVRMSSVDVVITTNCIRNDLSSAVEEAVCGTEGLAGGVEYVSKPSPGVACSQLSNELIDNRRGADVIKKAVSDYVVQLLTPLYKTKKLQKDDFKAIVKKSTAKVMDRSTSRDNNMDVSEFLNLKRKVKIRSLVDMYIERHLKGGSR